MSRSQRPHTCIETESVISEASGGRAAAPASPRALRPHSTTSYSFWNNSVLDFCGQGSPHVIKQMSLTERQVALTQSGESGHCPTSAREGGLALASPSARSAVGDTTRMYRTTRCRRSWRRASQRSTRVRATERTNLDFGAWSQRPVPGEQPACRSSQLPPCSPGWPGCRQTPPRTAHGDTRATAKR